MDKKLKNIQKINKGKRDYSSFSVIGLFLTQHYLQYPFLKEVFWDSEEIFFTFLDPFWEQQPLQKVDSFYTKITFFIERYSDQY